VDGKSPLLRCAFHDPDDSGMKYGVTGLHPPLQFRPCGHFPKSLHIIPNPQRMTMDHGVNTR
jgi:hypothetical protein